MARSYIAAVAAAALLGIVVGAAGVYGAPRIAPAVSAVNDAPAVRALRNVVAPSPAPTAVPDARSVRDAVQAANEAQVRAIARADASVMHDSATAQHYAEMVRVNDQLLAAGIVKIELLKTEWGDVRITGDTATAVTYETWQSTFSDGTTQRSRDENDYTLVREGGRWLVSADQQPGTTAVTAPAPRGPAPAAVASGHETSSNWSGYSADGGRFSAVGATWTVPQPRDGTDGVEATWVGIGGVASRDLIQAGTQTIASGGSVQYSAWIEMLPASSRTVPLAVSPGDRVRASITNESGNTWRISLEDLTTGKSYATTVAYRSTFSSAGWIEEAPSGGRSVLPLSDFGTVGLKDAWAIKDGKRVSIAAAGGRPITMINAAGQALAEPSGLGPDGASFTVTRTSAPANVNPYRRRFGD